MATEKLARGSKFRAAYVAARTREKEAFTVYYGAIHNEAPRAQLDELLAAALASQKVSLRAWRAYGKALR